MAETGPKRRCVGNDKKEEKGGVKEEKQEV